MECNRTDLYIAAAGQLTPSRTYRMIVISISTTFIIFGNVANIYILPTMNSLNKVSKIFFVNLSIADMLVGLSVGVPALVTTIANDVWLLGEPYCYISGILHVTATNVSMTTLTAICVVRYVAVTRPFTYRMISRGKCFFACALIWLYCIAVFVVPMANQATVVRFSVAFCFCTICWTQLWSALLPFATIMIPCIVSLMSSGINIIIILRRSQIPTEFTSTNDSLRREKKAIWLTIVTTVCFGACWLPFAIVAGVRLLHRSTLYDMPMLVRFFGMWIGNANSFINVCIYSSIYPEYRRKLKQILLFWRPADHVVSVGGAVSTVNTTSIPDRQ